MDNDQMTTTGRTNKHGKINIEEDDDLVIIKFIRSHSPCFCFCLIWKLFVKKKTLVSLNASIEISISFNSAILSCHNNYRLNENLIKLDH